jgi:Trk-type K+ transport system membrane component
MELCVRPFPKRVIWRLKFYGAMKVMSQPRPTATLQILSLDPKFSNILYIFRFTFFVFVLFPLFSTLSTSSGSINLELRGVLFVLLSRCSPPPA